MIKQEAASMKQNEESVSILYVLDTNVLIHDPNAILNFHEHHVAIPMTVLEELDKLKTGNHSVAAECRQAIRLIDSLLGESSADEVEAGVAIKRPTGRLMGRLLIISDNPLDPKRLSNDLNDNRIINQSLAIKNKNDFERVVLVTKDINMRLKARASGLDAEDYRSDQLIEDNELLSSGYHTVEGSFWDSVEEVSTRQQGKETWHELKLKKKIPGLSINEFLIDQNEQFIGWVKEIDGINLLIKEINRDELLHQEAWGLKPRDIYQSLALYALLDPDVHLVNLTGSAGSGKTILALAAAIEQTISTKLYKKIIVTRSVQGLDEDIGFLPGTEAEKMEPWLGAITDNLEALHDEDESTPGSIDYIMQKIPLQFKSLNYIRGRSFQHSFILIDECQNLTPHQMKTIITRAGNGSKVICLGNLEQIDTPYLSANSSGLTYLTERFKNFAHGAHINLQGVPRSLLAQYAEEKL